MSVRVNNGQIMWSSLGGQVEDRKLKSNLEWPNDKVSTRNLVDPAILPKRTVLIVLLSAKYREDKF